MNAQASTHPFTCNTCHVAFRSSELQRTHMQSDWHRYNLKRRVASLPPLSSEIFDEKVLANRAESAATAARASFEKNCEPCRKSFYSENAFVNHLSSTKHKANAVKAASLDAGKGHDDSKSIMSSTFSLGEPADKFSTMDGSTMDGQDSDADDDDLAEAVLRVKDTSLDDTSSGQSTGAPQSGADSGNAADDALSSTTRSSNHNRLRPRDPLKECLFCTKLDFESLNASIEHMTKVHGLFVPEPNYIDDIEGLFKYLNQKVSQEYQCLYCGRLKWSEDGIKTHMRDMSHCKIAYENEDQQLEIGQFYDFRSTYSDDDWSDEEESDENPSDEGAAPGGGVKLGAKRPTTASPTADEADEGWETDSTASSVPTEELGRIYVDEQRDEVRERLRTNRHHSHAAASRHRGSDGAFHSHAHHLHPTAVYHDDIEIKLPSGRTAGHRSLNRIWRQNLRSYPSPAERATTRLLTAAASDQDNPDEEQTESHNQTQIQKPSALARERERGRAGQMARSERAAGLAGLDEGRRREVRVARDREARRADRDEKRFLARVGRTGNQQKHFRDPLLQ